MTAYIPQPGTVAARVVAYLRTLPSGVMQSSAVIAEALDCDPEIGPYMKLAYENGLVSREKRDGRLWWGIGYPGLRSLSAPLPVSADDDDVDEEPIVQRTVPATKPSSVSLVDVPAWCPKKEAAMNKPGTTVAPPPVQEATCRTCRLRPVGSRAEEGAAAATQRAQGGRLALPNVARSHGARRLGRPSDRGGQGARHLRQEGQGQGHYPGSGREHDCGVAALT